MEDEKQIRWVGSSYDDLLAFPKDARKEAGFQLGKVQAGLDRPTGNRSTMLVPVQERFASGTQAASTV
jgi:phage-related protein